MNQPTNKPILQMGAMADPVSRQLKRQHLPFDKNTIRAFQGQLDAVTTLRINDLITAKQATTIRLKITKQLYFHIKEMQP